MLLFSDVAIMIFDLNRRIDPQVESFWIVPLLQPVCDMSFYCEQ